MIILFYCGGRCVIYYGDVIDLRGVILESNVLFTLPYYWIRIVVRCYAVFYDLASSAFNSYLLGTEYECLHAIIQLLDDENDGVIVNELFVFSFVVTSF